MHVYLCMGAYMYVGCVFLLSLSQLISAGTEQFNRNPKAGVAFLEEQGVLESPLNPKEVAHFLMSNPSINKQVLGEFFSSKKNVAVLEAFVG